MSDCDSENTGSTPVIRPCCSRIFRVSILFNLFIRSVLYFWRLFYGKKEKDARNKEKKESKKKRVVLHLFGVFLQVLLFYKSCFSTSKKNTHKIKTI